MKNKLLGLLIAVHVVTFGQLPYIFSMNTQSFQYLSAPTILTGSPSSTINLPFNFNMFGSAYSTATINLTNDGYIKFGNVGIPSFTGQMNMENTNSQTSYEVTGSAPSRIFKIEWKHHGLSYSTPQNDSITYQVWLYETTDVIEWHFGPNAWNAGSFSSAPFVMVQNGSTFYNIYGSPASPTFTLCGLTCHLNGIPASGKVYILTPTPSIVKEVDSKIQTIVSPNPAKDILKIDSKNFEFENAKIEISGYLGQKVMELPYSNEINVSSLVSGCYILKLESGDQVHYSRFMKE